MPDDLDLRRPELRGVRRLGTVRWFKRGFPAVHDDIPRRPGSPLQNDDTRGWRGAGRHPAAPSEPTETTGIEAVATRASDAGDAR
jgi:hypothetical protein